MPALILAIQDFKQDKKFNADLQRLFFHMIFQCSYKFDASVSSFEPKIMQIAASVKFFSFS